MLLPAVGIFVVTLALVIWRPKGLSIGWAALGGAALALVAHVVTLADIWRVVGITWDATLTFVGLIVMSMVLDELGFFEWAALRMAFAARGDGRRVFLYVILLGALVSAFFANDGAALILTPIVLEKVRLLRFGRRHMLPFIMAGGFIADATSFPFTISNLVNIISADYFHIGFVSYALRMFVPNLLSLAVSLLVLYLYFRHDIVERYEPALLPAPHSALKDVALFRLSWGIMGFLLLGYMLTEFVHIPVSAVALFVAAVLLAVAARAKVVRASRIIREAPWQIVFFSVGMYVVVYGLSNVGLTRLLGESLHAAARHGLYAGILYTGFLAAVLSSVMNNLPSVMIGALAIHDAGATAPMREAMAYANVVGCDLGPKLTPLGSLATLLWLHVMRRKGVTITWREYMKAGFTLTIPTLFVTLSGLCAWLALTRSG
jgi:arsenical pump membrane protein